MTVWNSHSDRGSLILRKGRGFQHFIFKMRSHGHCGNSRRSLYGHCTVTVRSLYGHCGLSTEKQQSLLRAPQAVAARPLEVLYFLAAANIRITYPPRIQDSWARQFVGSAKGVKARVCWESSGADAVCQSKTGRTAGPDGIVRLLVWRRAAMTLYEM